MGKKNKNKKNANSLQEPKQAHPTAENQQQQPQRQQQPQPERQPLDRAVQSQEESQPQQDDSGWQVAGERQARNSQQRDERKSTQKPNERGSRQYHVQSRTDQKPTQPKNVRRQDQHEPSRSQLNRGQFSPDHGRLDKQQQSQENVWINKPQSTAQSRSHGQSTVQQQQRAWPAAGSSHVGNVQQIDEGKSSQQRNEPGSHQQHHAQSRTEQKPTVQSKNVWRQDQKDQFRSQSNQSQSSPDYSQLDRQQQIQKGALSRKPQNSGFPRAESSQAMQPKKKSAATSSGEIKSQQKRPELPTMEELAKKGITRLTVEPKGSGKRGLILGEIETNYVQLLISQIPDYIYHYDVSFNPERPKKLLGRVFGEFVANNFSQTNIYIVFDGSRNAYASQPLSIDSLVHQTIIKHPETGRQMEFNVNIQEANNSQIPFRAPLTGYADPSVDPKRALQGLDVILKAAFQNGLEGGVVSGRSFFLRSNMLRSLNAVHELLDLGDGFELRLGLFQSVVLGFDELYLNVDVSHKAFPKRYDSFIELLKDMQLNVDFSEPLQDQIIDRLRRQISGLDVCYTQPGSGTKTIRKFMNIEPKPDSVEFELNGVSMTVQAYFNDREMRIQYPELPCIRIGNRDHNIIVPIEFCSISDAQVTNRTSDNQTQKIIKVSATTTKDRKSRIMYLLKKINHNRSNEINGFGINIEKRFIDVTARQLDPPIIQYKNAITTPKDGVWNMKNAKFLLTGHQPATEFKWGILKADSYTDESAIGNLCEMLYKSSVSVGLCLASEPLYKIMIVRNRERVPEMELQRRICEKMQWIAEKKEISIMFCVIPDRGEIYGKIKTMAELEYGVLTQCIKSKTVINTERDEGKGATTISNILLKVNAKLNGTNHKLQMCPILHGSKKRSLYIGADVTHPSPDLRHTNPSIVGVSASYDENAFRYAFYWRLQGARIPFTTAFRVVEIIQDFKEVVKSILMWYKSDNDALPDQIFYYRDGVSDGQFDQVMAVEKNAIDEACREIKAGYEKQKKLTVIVVQKRHHTRFFPLQNGVGKFNNVPPGTIVDTKIIRPNENNFFLVSHQSIQGVAKPTKYCILLDEGNHSIDDLEELTNNLCYMFSRCNRAVSYPAPTYYAHLIAERAKKYVTNTRNFERLDCKNSIKENIIHDHPMFFV